MDYKIKINPKIEKIKTSICINLINLYLESIKLSEIYIHIAKEIIENINICKVSKILKFLINK
jgi:hypothetical protein